MFLISAFVLLRLSVPANAGPGGAWLTDSGRRTAEAIGLTLIPFAGAKSAGNPNPRWVAMGGAVV